MKLLADLPWLYWLRLRTRPVQELLALAGIAVGVALLFAVQVANSSVTGSVRQLVDGLTGSAELALVARDPRGLDARTAAQAQALDGVRGAAPLLLARATAEGPEGRVQVELAGVTPQVSSLGGPLARAVQRAGGRAPDALLVSEQVARSAGVEAGDVLRLQVFGRSQEVPVAIVAGRRRLGALAGTPLAVAPLPLAQRLTGLRGRVTHVLVAPAAGRRSAVQASLTALAADRADVVPSDQEARLIEQAAGPNEQSTGMFAAISMLVGVLFTFNAMLLTIPERRRFVAELRMQGFGRTQLTALLLFEALALGVLASLVGLLIGDQLSRHVFHAVPGYLSFAFPVGGARIVRAEDLALAFAGGLLATLLAAGRLLLDVHSRRPLDAAYRSSGEPGEGIPPAARRWLLAGAAGLVAFAAGVYLFAPGITTLAVGALGVAMVLVLPSVLELVMRGADRLADTGRGGLLAIAVAELRASTTRATALAATGALAVFGSVAIEGAHQDLVRGLDDNQATYVGTADVWATAGGDENSLTTAPFAPPERTLRELRADPAVREVRAYRGGFLDLAGRRAWIVAREPAGRSGRVPVPDGQVVDGTAAGAEQLLGAGGAAVVSEGLAEHLGVGVGDTLRLPTPTGTAALTVAATVTNLGWSPGAILLAGRDYARLWGTRDVTGLEVDLRYGVAPEEGRRLVQDALGAGAGSGGAAGAAAALTVETAAQRLERLQRLSREGLDRLSQISTLMLVAAALAMAAAMTGAVWQQRRRLAVLRMQGFDVEQVWGVLILQSAIVLAVGSALGAATGLAGQVLATRWVALSTGYPALFSPAVALAALTFAGVALVALLVVSIPGWLAARVSPAVSFQGD